VSRDSRSACSVSTQRSSFGFVLREGRGLPCGQSARFGFGYVASVEDLIMSPQLAARGFFRVIDHPGCRPRGPPRPAVRARYAVGAMHAPLLGEHTEEVLGESASPHALTALPLKRRAATLCGPCTGYVSSTSPRSGPPRAAMTLADLGAEVIKIESRDRAGPARAPAGGEGASERQLQRRRARRTCIGEEAYYARPAIGARSEGL
jgi:hypothetical protein